MNSSKAAQSQIDFANNVFNPDDFYKQIVDSLDDCALFTLNNQSHITSWNSGAKNLFFYNEAEIIGKDIKFLFADLDTRMDSQLNEGAASISNLEASERYFVCKDGTVFLGSDFVFPLKDINGKLIGFTKVIKNISAKKVAEERIFKAKAFAKSLVEDVGYPLVVIHKDFRIQCASNTFISLFESSQEKLEGENIFTIWDNLPLKQMLTQHVLDGNLSEGVDILHEFGKQGKKAFHVKIKKVDLYKNYPEMIFLAMEEIALSGLISQPKNDFISVASHELKTPITVIKLYSQILEKLTSSDEHISLRNPILKIQEQADKLSQLLSVLLDLSQLQAGSKKLKFENFELTTVIDEALANLELVQNSRHLEFKNKVVGSVSADKMRISQVLNIFLANAVKYSPSKDAFYIDMYKNDADKEYMITISDVGDELPDQERNSLLQRFSKADRLKNYSIHDAGLELFIASEIVHQHGGDIGFASEENIGTEFFFTIPMRD